MGTLNKVKAEKFATATRYAREIEALAERIYISLLPVWTNIRNGSLEHEAFRLAEELIVERETWRKEHGIA